MYENSHLFPRLSYNDTTDRWDVASSVIGAKLGIQENNSTVQIFFSLVLYGWFLLDVLLQWESMYKT